MMDPTPPSNEWGRVLEVKAGTNQFNQRMLRVTWENIEIHYVRDEVATWRLDALVEDKLFRNSGRMTHDEVIANVMRNPEVFKDDEDLLKWLTTANAEMQ